MRLTLFCLFLFVAVSLCAQKGQTVYISDSFSNVDSFRTELKGKGVTIVTTPQEELQVVTLIYSSEKGSRSFAQWKTAAGIEIRQEKNTVTIRTREDMDTLMEHAGRVQEGASTYPGTVVYEEGRLEIDQVLETLRREALASKKYLPASFLIFVPHKVAVQLHNQGGLIELKDNLDFLSMKGRNVNIRGQSLAKAELHLVQSTAQFRNIQKATIDLHSTSLTLDSMQTASVHAAESIIAIKALENLVLNSHLDEISIESASKITGTKKYGRLSIGSIQDRLDLAAENTQLSVGRISDTVQSLHIENKFAALQINISSLNAFRVHIAGRGNRYSLPKIPALKGLRTLQLSDSARTYRSGSPAVKETLLHLKCQGCLIQFN